MSEDWEKNNNEGKKEKPVILPIFGLEMAKIADGSVPSPNGEDFKGKSEEGKGILKL